MGWRERLCPLWWEPGIPPSAGGGLGSLGPGWKGVSEVKPSPVLTSFPALAFSFLHPAAAPPQSHRRQHNKDKPFKCHNCHRAYTDAASLEVHLATHTVKHAKVYTCSICSRAYTSVSVCCPGGVAEVDALPGEYLLHIQREQPPELSCPSPLALAFANVVPSSHAILPVAGDVPDEAHAETQHP